MSVNAADTVFREATLADVPAMFEVRTSVIENAMSWERLAELGITPASVAASLMTDCKGWVAERDGRTVAFAIADGSDASIFALFVRPEHAGCGIGTRLLELAVLWLRQRGAAVISLTTGPGTRAAGFYARRGWVEVGIQSNGEVRFELRRGGSCDEPPAMPIE
jgi:GNAT superfamily N-acetyltransferase